MAEFSVHQDLENESNDKSVNLEIHDENSSTEDDDKLNVSESKFII